MMLFAVHRIAQHALLNQDTRELDVQLLLMASSAGVLYLLHVDFLITIVLSALWYCTGHAATCSRWRSLCYVWQPMLWSSVCGAFLRLDRSHWVSSRRSRLRGDSFPGSWADYYQLEALTVLCL